MQTVKGFKLFIYFVFCTCICKAQSVSNNSPYNKTLDSCNFYVCTLNQKLPSCNESFILIKKLDSLSQDEINEVKRLTNQAIKKYSSEKEVKHGNVVSQLEKTPIKIISGSIFFLKPFVTADKKKVVLISYCCEDPNDLIPSPPLNEFCEFSFYGGGNCHFGFWANLDDKKTYAINVNGHL